MLSRKYYKAVAEILRDRFNAKGTQDGTTEINLRSEELRVLTREFITFFKTDNSRFDESRFLSAVNSKSK